ncbi:hypothetical protein KKH05_03145 [Patescibacteria group bacterium]|nr:hypothetical protein [Patescibacteria group bacterium]
MKPAAQRLLGILASFLLIVGSMVTYASLIVPEYREIQDLRGELVATNVLLEEEKLSIEAVEALIQEFESISDLRKATDLRLPSEENVAYAVNQIQGITSSNGMLLNSLSIRPLPVVVDENIGGTEVLRPLGSMRILVEAFGDYESLKSFLEAVETNVRFMEVHSLSVSGGNADGPYEYQMEIDTYYQF